MQEFYKQYFSPASKQRTRVSVHLHARGAGELDLKIIELLQKMNLNDVPTEKRQNLELLESHLKTQSGLSEEDVTKILAEAKETGLKQSPTTEEEAAVTADLTAVEDAVEVTDISRYRSSMPASAGPTPAKDLSEFEENEAKL